MFFRLPKGRFVVVLASLFRVPVAQPGRKPKKENFKEVKLGTRNYELLFIANPELDATGFESLLGKVNGYLQAAGGVVYYTEDWGLRRLAYPIQQYREGHYYLIRFTMDSLKVKAFERNLYLAEGVMRELITLDLPKVSKKTVAQKAESSAVVSESEPSVEFEDEGASEDKQA